MSSAKERIKCLGCGKEFALLLSHLERTKFCQDFYDMKAMRQDSATQTKERKAQRSRERYKQSPEKKKKSMAAYNEKHRPEINDCMKKNYREKSHGYECPICEKAFHTLSHVNRHFDNAHSGEEPTEAHSGEEPTEICQICDKAFSRRDNLDRHIREVHGEEKMHKCMRCIAIFTRKEDLVHHEKMGKHVSSYDCEYCFQNIAIKSPQTEINNRHLIKHPTYPHLTTCRNIKYGLIKPTEEEEKKFHIKMRDKHIKIWAEQEAFKTYKRTDARFIELVDRLIKEETEQRIKRAEEHEQYKLKKKMIEEAWEAYKWDVSMLDPTSMLPMSYPVRNKKCGHRYEESYIKEYIKQEPSPDSRVEHAHCTYAHVAHVPVCKGKEEWVGCTIDPISLDDLEPDRELKEEIDRRKEEMKKNLEEGFYNKGNLVEYAKRQNLFWSRREFNLFISRNKNKTSKDMLSNFFYRI